MASAHLTPLISKLSDFKPKQQTDYKPWNRFIHEDLGVIDPSTSVVADKAYYLQLCAMFITHVGNQFVRSVSRNMNTATAKGKTETNIGFPIHSGTYHVLIENGDQKYVAVVDRKALQKKKFTDSNDAEVNINPRNVVKSTDLIIGPIKCRDIFRENKMQSLAEFVADQVADQAATFIVYNNKPVMNGNEQAKDKQGRPIFDKLYYVNLRWGPSRENYGYYTPAADYNKPTFTSDKHAKPVKHVKQIKQRPKGQQQQSQQQHENADEKNRFDALEQESNGSSEVIMPADAALASTSMAKAIAEQSYAAAAAAAPVSTPENPTPSP
jgi:hypothetical protein